MPGWPPAAWVGMWKAGHRHHAIHAEQSGDADRVAQIVGVFGSDLRVGVQRVAITVQARDRYPAAVERRQVLLRGDVPGQQFADRQVWRGQEPTGIDLGSGEPQGGDDLQRFTQRLVMQDGGVDTELHFRYSS